MMAYKKYKSISELAEKAAMRTVPMAGDPEAYRRAVDYFRIGYFKGFRAAHERATRGK